MIFKNLIFYSFVQSFSIKKINNHIVNEKCYEAVEISVFVLMLVIVPYSIEYSSEWQGLV